MMKMRVGVALIILAFALMIMSFLGRGRTDTVIDVSFILGSGEEHDSYHHTHILGRSTLVGDVIVENGNVRFSVQGIGSTNLKDLLIRQNYSFSIDKAEDLYRFHFKNDADDQSFIGFILTERWNDNAILIRGFIFSIIVIAIGVSLIFVGVRHIQAEKTGTPSTRAHISFPQSSPAADGF